MCVIGFLTGIMATQRALPEDGMLRVCCFGELPEVYAEQLGSRER